MATLRIHLVPNAKVDSVVGELATASSRGGHDRAIKIKLRAPAVEGKANAALIRFLAEKMNLREPLFFCAARNRATNSFGSIISPRIICGSDYCEWNCPTRTRRKNCTIANTRRVAIPAKNGQNAFNTIAL